MEFDALLQLKHLAYTATVDHELIKQMQDTWDIFTQDRKQPTASDIDSFLSSYIKLGMLADENDPSIQFSSKTIVARGTPTEPVVQHSSSFSVSYQILHSNASMPDEKHPIAVLELPLLFSSDTLSGWFSIHDDKETFYVSSGNAKGKNLAILSADHRYMPLLHYLQEDKISLNIHGIRKNHQFSIISCNVPEDARGTFHDDLLQMILERIRNSKDITESNDSLVNKNTVLFSDMKSIETFLHTAGNTFPSNIRNWAFQNLETAKSTVVSYDEQMHARHALSLMCKIQWGSSYFPAIDPVQARKILDEELYGMENVKQRIIEIIVQINRTHTLPAYGMLLVGPAGTGKSQISYAVARILQLPYASLSMSTIQDGEALTGSPRIYRNAKPGKIMEALEQAGSSNLVLVINELDKADQNRNGATPSDTLLTLFDGLGFIDNYVECTIPTYGIYPIATANETDRISTPLLSRFAVIEIQDYTKEERYVIFRDYTMPKVLKRIGILPQECIVTPQGVQAVLDFYENEPGVRRLEQAAEQIAANALYQIETKQITSITYDKEDIIQLLSR